MIRSEICLARQLLTIQSNDLNGTPIPSYLSLEYDIEQSNDQTISQVFLFLFETSKSGTKLPIVSVNRKRIGMDLI